MNVIAALFLNFEYQSTFPFTIRCRNFDKRHGDAHHALGEALAHLHKLWFDGLLRRELGDDGVMRFVVK